MKRVTVTTGVYRDKYGYEVRWRDGSKRFPLDVPLEDLKAYRARQQRQATERKRHTDGGSFVRDVARFLRTRRGRPSFKSDRAHLRPWVHRFRQGSRFSVTRDAVQLVVNAWRDKGYSPRELRHRVRILRQLFRWLDPGQPTPCDGVALPKIVKRKPRPVAAAIVRDVALQLWKQEQKGVGRLRDAKTRARFLVLALTGQRPAQVMRARPADLDWDRGLWYVDPAKGDEGTIVAFNAQIRAAWELFTAADAWGYYDSRSFSKTLQRNGWPKGVRPYQLRHTVGQMLKEQGTDLGDIQDALGHASPATTAQFYVGPSLERLRAISARLEGRVSPMAVSLPQSSTRKSDEQKGKGPDFPERFRTRPGQAKSRLPRPRSSKTA